MRVLRWKVPIDDEAHEIGGGQVALVGMRSESGVVEVWTIETAMMATRKVQIYGTGHRVPDDAEYVGSTISPTGLFVWHVFQL